MKKMHRALKAAGVAAGMITAAAAVAAGTHAEAARMVFKNLTAKKLKQDAAAEWIGGTVYEKIPYASDSESQYLDLYVPDAGKMSGEEGGSNKPRLFVLVHGGGFIAGDSQTRQTIFMYQYFRDRGYACATVNYRLAQEAPFPAGLEDVKAAMRYLESRADEYGYDASRIAIWGESAGGYLACAEAFTDETEFCGVRYIGQDEDETAGRSFDGKADVLIDYYGAVDLGAIWTGSGDWKTLGVPQAVISVANSWMDKKTLEGFSSVESYWLRKEFAKMSGEEKQRSDPHYYLEKNMGKTVSPAVMIVHGDCDITVPYLQSQRLCDQLKGLPGGERTEFLLVPGAGHAADILYADEILAQVDRFIREY